MRKGLTASGTYLFQYCGAQFHAPNHGSTSLTTTGKGTSFEISYDSHGSPGNSPSLSRRSTLEKKRKKEDSATQSPSRARSSSLSHRTNSFKKKTHQNLSPSHSRDPHGVTRSGTPSRGEVYPRVWDRCCCCSLLLLLFCEMLLFIRRYVCMYIHCLMNLLYVHIMYMYTLHVLTYKCTYDTPINICLHAYTYAHTVHVYIPFMFICTYIHIHTYMRTYLCLTLCT